MMKLPKTLTLDCDKWRCGDNGEVQVTALGFGSTKLENEDGYQCCLGQFACQAGAKEYELLDISVPSSLQFGIEGLNRKSTNGFTNTQLSEICMEINDDKNTTIKQKIILLRKQLAKTGRKLVVKNLKKVLK